MKDTPDLSVPLIMARDNGSGGDAFLRDAMQAIRDSHSEIRRSQRELDEKIDRGFQLMREERKTDIRDSEARLNERIRYLEEQVKPLVNYAQEWKRRYRDVVAVGGAMIAIYGLLSGWIQSALVTIFKTIAP